MSTEEAMRFSRCCECKKAPRETVEVVHCDNETSTVILVECLECGASPEVERTVLCGDPFIEENRNG